MSSRRDRCPVCKHVVKRVPRACTTAVAARVFGLSPSTLLRAIQHKQVKAWQTTGGHYRVVLADVSKSLGVKAQ